VSFGGVVLVDEKPFGMTVHHMLEPLSEAESEYASSDASDTASEVTSSDDENIRSDDDRDRDRMGRTRRSSGRTHQTSSALSGRQRSDASNAAASADGNASSDISDYDDSSSDVSSDTQSESDIDAMDSDEPSNVGDTDGYCIDTERKLPITQPALCDAVERGWHAQDIAQEDQDDDHLLTFKLGRLHASSGLRRSTHDGIYHEIDWALVELDPPRLQPYNLILGGRQHCQLNQNFCPQLESPVLRNPDASSAFTTDVQTQAKRTRDNTFEDEISQYPSHQDLYPLSVLPADLLSNRAVLCFGRTSGLATGTVDPRLSFVKMRGRRSYSNSWALIGDFGAGGDSGAWIIDCEEGKVVGHVLAENDGITYFCPMELLIEDMKKTLSAERIRLPGGEDIGPRGKVSGAQEQMSAKTPMARPSTHHDALEQALGALRMDSGNVARSRMSGAKRRHACKGMRRSGQVVS